MLSQYKKSFALISITIISLILSWVPQRAGHASNHGSSNLFRAKQQLSLLTTEEKVGQLFLITFPGDDSSEISSIYNLIVNYHVGGVILDRDNNNFQNPDSILEDCWNLIYRLQLLEYEFSESAVIDDIPEGYQSDEYIPLFIGLSQEGNLSQYSEILTGISPIPSQMALGATWNPELAELVGEQVGRELSALGINLLFGPSLDVVSNTSSSQSDLGVRSFGGDPYWVGKFGQSYIKGVHNGGLTNLVVVGKYFPGLGSSDRLPEQEIATVRKSLDQLKQIDLAPFFAVTGNSPSPDMAVDAILNSHIRYQGLQGNIRSTTRPVSLDPQALDLLLNLDPLRTWHEDGGLIISDNLGSRALQALYDPTGESFDISRLALDAFIAGNDILFLGNYGDENKPIPDFDIIATLNFFAQKYDEDQDFAARVDESVLRILSLKNSIYPNFQHATVQSPQSRLSLIGEGKTAELVARQSATLINPSLIELDEAMPNPPTMFDRLVILTDTDFEKICTDCPDYPTLGKTAVEDTIIKLYGPLSGNQLVRANLTSYSFKDVITLLDFPSEAEQMATDLHYANWIIISALDISDDRPYSKAITRLLAERQDLLRDKRIIVFAFGAPYYLDATNISKITAYVGLYSKLPAFQEVAAKFLFKEFPSISGNLPVSVPGINYDLISITSPDPDRGFTIFIGDQATIASTLEPDSATPAAPVYRVEDQIDLTTGTILDYNGNPVPDGTPVTFFITTQGVSTPLPQVTTLNGNASTSFLIETRDNITIHAESSLARSNDLEIIVIGESLEIETETAATPESPTEVPEIPATLVDGDSDQNLPDVHDTESPWQLWLISIIIISIVSFTAYQVGALAGLVRWGLRWGFSALISGLLFYNYFLLELPGVHWLLSDRITPITIGIVVFVGSLIGWLIAFLYQRLVPA